MSEGLDFSDESGRAVVITGIPFPPKNVRCRRPGLPLMLVQGPLGAAGCVILNRHVLIGVAGQDPRVLMKRGFLDEAMQKMDINARKKVRWLQSRTFLTPSRRVSSVLPSSP